jgi:hypothetical protein
LEENQQGIGACLESPEESKKGESRRVKGKTSKSVRKEEGRPKAE